MLLHFFHAALSSRPAYLRRVILALTLLGLSALGHAASANTLTVPAQYATIQAAINAAVSGDTVLISDGTYTGPGDVDLDFGGRNVTVTSVHGPARTVINCGGFASNDGSGNHRGFILQSGETNAVIRGMTVKNGYESGTGSSDGAGGAIEILSGSVTVQNCILTGNTAQNSGGGLDNEFFSTATLTNCALEGNTAQYGGGLYNNGTAAVTNCTFTGNTAPNGCGLENDYSGSATLTNDVLYGDIVSSGPEIGGYGGLDASDCDVQGGYAGAGDFDADPLFLSGSSPYDLHLTPGSPCLGAGTASGAPTTTLDGYARPNPPSIGAYELSYGIVVTTPTDEDNGTIDPSAGTGTSLREAINYADLHPGGMITFDPTAFAGGRTIQLTLGSLNVSAAMTITGPGAWLVAIDGGQQYRVLSIAAPSGVVTILGLTFQDGTDRADGAGGGGIQVTQGGLTLTGCTVIANTATHAGGIVNAAGALRLTGCTITGNTATAANGGGLYNYSGPMTLTDCVISSNTAAVSYGGGIETGGTSTLTGCTVANNSALYGAGLDNAYANLTITDCTFTGNSAAAYGGAIKNGGSVTLTNCTLSGNAAPANGGGAVFTSGGSTAISLTNDVLYADTGGEILDFQSQTALTASHCDVQSGYAGVGDIAAVPLFVSPADGDVHLSLGSPCLGAGTAAGASPVDKDGRAHPNPPSIGAYELADTRTVPAQYATIQAAINAAVSGDTVLISDGTYTGPGNVDLDFGGKNITVTSANGPSKTVVDCGGSYTRDGSGDHRGFWLHSGEANAVIRGLTVKNGYESGNGSSDYAGGGIEALDVTVTIQNCALTADTAGAGGGIYSLAYDGGIRRLTKLTLTGCTLTGNTATSTGGGLYNFGMVSLTGCTLTANTAVLYGGGLINEGSGTATLTDCTLAGNAAQGGGGGLFNEVGTATLTGCALVGNTTQDGDGGGLYNYGPCTATLTNCILAGNTAPYGDGGGLYNNGGTDTLTNCTLTGNTAIFGGGLYNDGGTATLTNDVLYGDTAPNGGSELSIYGAGSATHCDVEGGLPAGMTDGGGNLNADPQFVSGTSPYDLHLRPGSPCLGAGTANGAPTTTIDGKTRPNPPAIGAYEAAAVGSTPTAVTVANVTGAAGQTVPLSATLKTTGGIALGGKTLTFSVDGTAVGVGVTNSGGVAVKTYLLPATVTVGAHALTAAFAGDAADSASSGTGALTVTRASTTLSVSAVVGSPGQAVTLKATLKRTAGGTAVAGETVSFSIDGTAVGTAVTTGAGLASLPYVIPAGDGIGSAHPVAAAFAGDAGNGASSGKGTLTVSKYADGLSVSAVTGTPGQAVTLSATLKRTAGGAAVAGGTVNFTVDGSVVGAGVTNASGLAALAYTVPANAALGGHPVTATFAGDAANAAALGKGALTVKNPAALSVANASGARGTSVTLSATLTLAGAVAPGRTLTFKVNGTSVVTAVTNSSGVASVTYAISATANVGSLPIAASFVGDAADNAAVGAGTLTVS